MAIEAKTREIEVPDSFLFLDVYFNLFVKALADPVGSEPNLEVDAAVSRDDSLRGDVREGSSRVRVEDAFSDLLECKVDVKVADILYFDDFLAILLK